MNVNHECSNTTAHRLDAEWYSRELARIRKLGVLVWPKYVYVRYTLRFKEAKNQWSLLVSP